MNKQRDKKRNIIIGNETLRVHSRRFKLFDSPEITCGKVKLNEIWYIFDMDSGRVIYQGNKWNDCLNGAKEFVKRYILYE